MSGYLPISDELLPLLNNACNGTIGRDADQQLASALNFDWHSAKRLPTIFNCGPTFGFWVGRRKPVMWSGSRASDTSSSTAVSFPCPHLPLHHPPRHGRLFLLGLAGGVSGGNGDFRDRA